MIALLLLLVCLVPEAQACVCMGSPHTRLVLPRDGAEGFPTDGRIRVLLRGDWPAELREVLGAEYRLRGPDGKLVPSRTEVEGLDLILVPEAPLAPNANHVLERLFAYEDGQMVDDDRRMALAGMMWRRRDAETTRGELVRAWFSEVSFRTGAGREARVPSTPGVVEAIWSVAARGSSCGPGETLRVSVATPATLRETDMIGLEIDRQGIVSQVAHRPSPEPTRRIIVGDIACGADKVHLDVAQPLRVRALAFSAAGQVSPAGPWVLATRKAGQNEEIGEQRPHGGGLEPASPAALKAWSAPPVVEGRAPPGPASCPQGLTVVESTTLTTLSPLDRREGEVLFTWKDRSRVLVEDSETKAIFVAEGPDESELVPVEFESRTPRGLAIVGDGGRLIAANETEAWEVRVWRPGPGGAPLWERLIQESGDEVRPSLVGGSDRVLAGWGRRRQVGDRKEIWPSWAVVEVSTGKVLGQGDLGAFSPATSFEFLGWDGTHFLLAWSWVNANAYSRSAREQPISDAIEEGSWFAAISADGSVEAAFRLPGDKLPNAIERVAGGWVIDWWGPQGRRVAWLDEEGRPVAGPYTFASAALAGGTVSAVNGELVALVGLDASGRNAMAVIDRSGALSPVLSIDGGQNSRILGFERWGEGFILVRSWASVKGNTGGTILETLACRSDPAPPRAPPRLAP